MSWQVAVSELRLSSDSCCFGMAAFQGSYRLWTWLSSGGCFLWVVAFFGKVLSLDYSCLRTVVVLGPQLSADDCCLWIAVVFG